MLARAYSYSLSPRTAWLIGAILTAFWLVIYLITVSPTVNFIDSGELITALHEPGVVHPPGYPLYTLLGYVASHVPIGEVAWRVNVFSAFWGAMAVGAMYALLITLSVYTGWLAARRAAPAPARRKGSRSVRAPEAETPTEPTKYGLTIVLSAIAGACLLGAASTFWNRSVQAKMYTLHYFFVLLLFWLAINYRWAYERGDKRASRRFLIIMGACLGLSFTNHLMTSLLLPGLAVLLLLDSRWGDRLRAMVQQWRAVLPALLLPLLLYLYLPVRASQGPVMDWGSPDTLPDFWRHISGWQYTAYVQDNLGESAGRLWGFATGQWTWQSWFMLDFSLGQWVVHVGTGTIILIALALGAGLLLARANLPIFLAMLITGLVTVGFALRYGISEIEPYLVPLYIMLIIWLGAALPLLNFGFWILDFGSLTPKSKIQNPKSSYGLPASAILIALALVSVILQFPRQNHSNDHLAELSVLNVFNNLEKDSIIITDHWDAVMSPSYYVQIVNGVRPDITIIDNSLLKYPWYLGQLEKRYPWLVANSRDIADTFSREQRKWVNGESYDGQLLNNSYFALLTSFIERNISKHPAYVFFRSQCDPSLAQQGEEGNQIAPNYVRQVSGMAYRLWPQPPPANSLPPEPKFDLQGYIKNKVPLDDFAKFNAGCYASAYTRLAQAYAGANNTAKAQEFAGMAAQLQQAIRGGQ